MASDMQTRASRGVGGIVLLAGILAAGCRSSSPQPPPLQRFEFTSPHVGTLFSITLYASDKSGAQLAAQAAFRRIAALDDIMSDYQADSELMRLCDQPPGTPVTVSAELFDVLQRAQKISELSEGAFDVTVGPYVRLWRFSRKRKVLPSPAEITAAAAGVGYTKLRLNGKARSVTLLAPAMRLDLGGIAKGYAADQALRLLKEKGIARALVAASGDIAIGNPPPGQKGWRVGIRAVESRTNQISRSIVLHNCGISTSGDTEQAVEINGVRYSHIVSPATGLGLTEPIQVSVIAPDATATDGLATAVSVLGVKRGLAMVESLPKTGALVLTKENGHWKSFISGRFKTLAGTLGQTRDLDSP